jgi:hypothetical protein
VLDERLEIKRLRHVKEKSEVRSQETEARSQEPEVRSQKSPPCFCSLSSDSWLLSPGF